MGAFPKLPNQNPIPLFILFTTVKVRQVYNAGGFQLSENNVNFLTIIHPPSCLAD